MKTIRKFLIFVMSIWLIIDQIMDIQARKEIIIEHFRQINDINLIKAFENLLDYALKKEKEKEIYEIPEAHQKLVMERFEEVRKDPERLLDWDQAKKTLKPG